MAKYYRNRPSIKCQNNLPGEEDAMDKDTQTWSEFDKHRKSILSDDVEEGWSSELRCYLGTMQRDGKKDTDIVEWWQVSIKAFVAHYPKLITIQ